MNRRFKGAHRRTRRARVNPLALVVAIAATVIIVISVITSSVGFGSPTPRISTLKSMTTHVAHPSSNPAPTVDPIVHFTIRVTPEDTPTIAPERIISPPPVPKTSSPTIPSGTLSCSGLETLWDDAGGNPAHAFVAAEIAKAESGGRQYAASPTNDVGYWQINRTAHPGLATFDPLGNAKAAILLSDNGRDWSPWTTYTSGAYRGKC